MKRFAGIGAADSLMGVFGYSRTSPTDSELAEMENAQEEKDYIRREERGENTPMPSPKYIMDDDVYFEHCWRTVTNLSWMDDHYEYELRPWNGRLIREDELV